MTSKQEVRRHRRAVQSACRNAQIRFPRKAKGAIMLSPEETVKALKEIYKR